MMNIEEIFEKELEAAFKSCKSENGMVPIKKLKVILRFLGFEPREDEIQQLSKLIMENETNRDIHPDSVSIDELKELLRNKFNKSSGKNEVKVAYQLFDEDSKGYISIADLRKVAKELGETIDDMQLREMIKEADSNGNGKVTEADFLAIMKKTSLY